QSEQNHVWLSDEPCGLFNTWRGQQQSHKASFFVPTYSSSFHPPQTQQKKIGRESQVLDSPGEQLFKWEQPTVSSSYGATPSEVTLRHIRAGIAPPRFLALVHPSPQTENE
ncbi:unnamed protein product, partial [Ectocarpus sp. 12 AP-2014]